MELQGKVVMITGASQGLGADLARRFAAEGAAVSLCARSAGPLSDVARELEESGARVLAMPCDVTDEDAVRAWVRDTRARFGRIDALVNNASMLGPRVAVEEYPLSDWRTVLDVNLTGAFLVAKHVVAALRETQGSLVHVSSGVGDHGRPLWGAYCASKNGLEALSEMLAGELEEDRVRSNAVDPGAMRTAMRAAAYPAEDPATLPRPREISDVFVWLVSDRSRGVSGRRFRAREFDAAAPPA
ncbi:MAG: SDR family NAD(P)-dependent oxidoreductase [Gemmatimonadota bacterium]|nr:SDR family NAD(P)-dependent oxidoreductase [Gemmatimonadota bacterium]